MLHCHSERHSEVDCHLPLTSHSGLPRVEVEDVPFRRSLVRTHQQLAGRQTHFLYSGQIRSLGETARLPVRIRPQENGVHSVQDSTVPSANPGATREDAMLRLGH